MGARHSLNCSGCNIDWMFDRSSLQTGLMMMSGIVFVERIEC